MADLVTHMRVATSWPSGARLPIQRALVMRREEDIWNRIMSYHPYAVLNTRSLPYRPNHHWGELESGVIAAASFAYGATALTSKMDA